jgi:hypothetical protein
LPQAYSEQTQSDPTLAYLVTRDHEAARQTAREAATFVVAASSTRQRLRMAVRIAGTEASGSAYFKRQGAAGWTYHGEIPALRYWVVGADWCKPVEPKCSECRLRPSYPSGR